MKDKLGELKKELVIKTNHKGHLKSIHAHHLILKIIV